jgi:hypothetical protein
MVCDEIQKFIIGTGKAKSATGDLVRHVFGKVVAAVRMVIYADINVLHKIHMKQNLVKVIFAL